MLTAAMNVLAGIILLVEMWRTIPAVGKFLDKFVRAIATFEAIIGIIAIVTGILNFGGEGFLAILAGLALGWTVLSNIPGIGVAFENFGKVLRSFQTILGFTAIIVGIVGLV